MSCGQPFVMEDSSLIPASRVALFDDRSAIVRSAHAVQRRWSTKLPSPLLNSRATFAHFHMSDNRVVKMECALLKVASATAIRNDAPWIRRPKCCICSAHKAHSSIN